MQGASHQKHRLREEVNVKVEEILSVSVPQGSITEEGVKVNISVALQYMNSWLLVMSSYEHLLTCFIIFFPWLTASNLHAAYQ